MKKNHKASGGKADAFLPESFVFLPGDEENARIYAVHLTTADQSEMRRAYLVSVMAANQVSLYLSDRIFPHGRSGKAVCSWTHPVHARHTHQAHPSSAS